MSIIRSICIIRSILPPTCCSPLESKHTTLFCRMAFPMQSHWPSSSFCIRSPGDDDQVYGVDLQLANFIEIIDPVLCFLIPYLDFGSFIWVNCDAAHQQTCSVSRQIPVDRSLPLTSLPLQSHRLSAPPPDSMLPVQPSAETRVSDIRH